MAQQTVPQDIVDYTGPDFQHKIMINRTYGLYVLPCGEGFTCLGFDVCYDRTCRMVDWLRRHGEDAAYPEPSDKGTYQAYSLYRAVYGVAERICFDKKIRCDVELTEQLIGLEGKRVEVDDNYGETRRFWVGKSTGWCPIHLEVKKSNSYGGEGASRSYKRVTIVSRYYKRVTIVRNSR
jgi:hypothetical protein